MPAFTRLTQLEERPAMGLSYDGEIPRGVEGTYFLMLKSRSRSTIFVTPFRLLRASVEGKCHDGSFSRRS